MFGDSDLEFVLLLFVGDGVAAADVEHVVEGAIALHPKAAFLVAGRFGSADSRRIGSAAGRRVRVFGCTKGERSEHCSEKKRLHI